MSTPVEQDQPTVTERDAILRERKAYVWGRMTYLSTYPTNTNSDAAKEEAKKAYPLPPRVRPRVVSDPHEVGIFWRVECSGKDKRMMVKNMGEFQPLWDQQSRYGLTEKRAAMWLNLYANPIEPIPEDE
jgi:hypothetical protein